MQQIYRRISMPKCDFNKVAKNFIEITVRHGCSPVNLLHVFITPFFKNISVGLLPAHLLMSNSTSIMKTSLKFLTFYYFSKCDQIRRELHFLRNVVTVLEGGICFNPLLHFTTLKILQCECFLKCVRTFWDIMRGRIKLFSFTKH